MKKIEIIYVIIYIFLLGSCETVSDNQTEANNAVETLDSEPDEDIDHGSILDKKFEINTSTGGQFLDYKENNATYSVKIAVRNLTNTRITRLKIKGYLRLVFQGGALRFHPGDGENFDDSDDDYMDNGYWGVEPSFNRRINKDSPWLPNEEINLVFNVPSDAPYSYNLDLYKSEFERTPTEVFFKFIIDALSIDGEFQEAFSYDIMQSWKDYQIQLGLR